MGTLSETLSRADTSVNRDSCKGQAVGTPKTTHTRQPNLSQATPRNYTAADNDDFYLGALSSTRVGARASAAAAAGYLPVAMAERESKGERG